MPFSNMQQENGIFFAKEDGYIDKSDAERWLKALYACAEDNPHPVIALIDATITEFISAPARLLLAEATRHPQVQCVVVAVSNPVMMQTVRMIGMLGEFGQTKVFMSLEDARYYAEQHVDFAASGD